MLKLTGPYGLQLESELPLWSGSDSSQKKGGYGPITLATCLQRDIINEHHGQRTQWYPNHYY